MPEDQPENTPSAKPDDENMLEEQPEKSVHKGKSMPKVDGHIKRDVSFLQKKLAELEIAVSEVQENVQKIDLSELEGFKQRMEDIEDLTMVENAAVIELKKMLEETKPGQQDASPQLEEKIGSLEQKIDSISIPNAEDIKSSVLSALPATADTSKMEQAMDAVKTSIETLKSDLESKISLVEQKASSVQTVSQPNAEGLKEDVKNYVLAKLPDYEWIKNELHSFKSYLDAEKIKLETLTNRMEKESQLPLPERAVDELEKIRNDWMVNIAKIDAVEKFVENFSNEMNQLKPIIKKLETFEKLMDLQTEITEKLETFKEYRDHIEKVMAENEETEKRIQREVSKIKNTEKMFTQIDDSMAVLSRELERNKHEVNEIITPLEEKLENFISITREDMSVFQGNLMVLEQGKADLTSSIANLQEAVFKKQPKNELAEIVTKMDSLEAEIESIKSLKPEDSINELVNKINELDGKVEVIRNSSIYDEQLSDLVSRLVFLESRLVAMEGMARYSPIVVE